MMQQAKESQRATLNREMCAEEQQLSAIARVHGARWHMHSKGNKVGNDNCKQLTRLSLYSHATIQQLSIVQSC